MPTHLDSDLLRTFVSVADTRNFTRAAHEVGRTQSAVSMQMKRLEAIVGEPLFERGPRGVALTVRGGELLINARRVVDLIDETAAALQARNLDGRVRIGIPEEYSANVLSRALSAFAKAHRQVEVLVRYGRSSFHMDALERGDIDLAVVFEWEANPQGEVLMKDPTVWATSEVHYVHDERPVPVALYESAGWCSEFATDLLNALGIDYRIAYRSDTASGLRLAVSSGLAIAPLSRSNIPAGCRELTEADGFGLIDSSSVVLYRRPGATGEATGAMADAIREAFRAANAGGAVSE
ncbi:MAG: LysR family transcriptional regulator [Rhizobiaceae bacterium]|nr:LysR family transcriptional regulator [Rhizobiaceae bacterium]